MENFCCELATTMLHIFTFCRFDRARFRRQKFKGSPLLYQQCVVDISSKSDARLWCWLLGIGRFATYLIDISYNSNEFHLQFLNRQFKPGYILNHISFHKNYVYTKRKSTQSNTSVGWPPLDVIADEQHDVLLRFPSNKDSKTSWRANKTH